MLSTNELHHYTTDKKNILNILENGFIPNFCCEKYLDGSKYWIPMVSFCDIPLDLASIHKEWYGEYAIAMKVDWSNKFNIHPVHYITNSMQDHNLAWALNSLKKHYFEIKSTEIKSIESKYFGINIPKRTDVIINGLIQAAQLNDYISDFNTLLHPISISMAFEKIFEGEQYYRKTNELKNKKFYDEKEWRYVPTLENINDYFKENIFNGMIDVMRDGGYMSYHFKDDVLINKFNTHKEISNFLNGNYDKMVKYSLKLNTDDVAYVIVPTIEDKEYINKNSKTSESINIKTWAETEESRLKNKTA